MLNWILNAAMIVGIAFLIVWGALYGIDRHMEEYQECPWPCQPMDPPR